MCAGPGEWLPTSWFRPQVSSVEVLDTSGSSTTAHCPTLTCSVFAGHYRMIALILVLSSRSSSNVEQAFL